MKGSFKLFYWYLQRGYSVLINCRWVKWVMTTKLTLDEMLALTKLAPINDWGKDIIGVSFEYKMGPITLGVFKNGNEQTMDQLPYCLRVHSNRNEAFSADAYILGKYDGDDPRVVEFYSSLATYKEKQDQRVQERGMLLLKEKLGFDTKENNPLFNLDEMLKLTDSVIIWSSREGRYNGYLHLNIEDEGTMRSPSFRIKRVARGQYDCQLYMSGRLFNGEVNWGHYTGEDSRLAELYKVVDQKYKRKSYRILQQELRKARALLQG